MSELVPMPSEGAEVVGMYFADDDDALREYALGEYRSVMGVDEWDDDGNRLYFFEPEATA